MSGSVTRRAFLLAAAASAAAARRAGDPYRIGIETYCFHDVDLAATLRHTAGLGLRYLELHDGHRAPGAAPGERSAARMALAGAGIEAEGVYIHDAFTESEAVARPIFDFARAMRFRYITGGPRREALPLLDRLVREYRVEIAIHNHGPGARYETLEDMTSVLEAHPSITACIDIGHFARSGVDPVGAIRAIGRRAVAVHVKDVDRAGGNVAVGDGSIDIPGVFRALDDVGFDGLLVLEYEGDLDDMGARLAGMRRSLAAMRRQIAA